MNKPDKPDQPSPPAPDNGNDEPARHPRMADPYSLGINLVVSVLVGMALGYGLDQWLGTKPWLMLLFLFLGFSAGLRRIMQQLDAQ